ncbi:ubiquitin-associated domain-containing protein 2-like isoform X2 [Apostichopus japonicus]
MFGGAGNGFYKTTVSKALMMICGSSSIAPLFLKKELKEIFTLNIEHLVQQSQLWRIVTSHLVIHDLHVLILVLLLIFNFRILERRYGSRKFASCILATSIMGSFLNLSLLGALYWWGYSPTVIHSGLIGTLGSLYVPFFCDIPNNIIPRQAAGAGGINPLMQMLTGKTLVYLLGLQLAISSACAPYQLITGILAGVLYRANFLGVQSYIVIPKFIAKWSSTLVGSLIDSGPPKTDPYPQGATLEIQRQMRTDYLEQRWMLMQARQNRPGRMVQRHQIGSPFNLFRRPQNRPLPPTPFQFAPRAEMNGNRPGNENLNPNGPSSSSAGPPPVVVSEERVQQLVDMGFNSSDVRTALQASNNDISLATNILLRD